MRTTHGTGGGRAAAPLHLLSSIFFVLFGLDSHAAELPHVYALVNARVVTAPGKVIEKGTVIVRGGVIAAVGAAGAVAEPADAQVMDLEGQTVSPGLIDPYVTVSRLSGARPSAPDESATGRRGAGAAAMPQATPAPEPSGNALPSSKLRPERSVHSDLKVSSDVREAFRDLGFTVIAAVPDKGILRGESAVIALSDGPLSRALLVAKSAQHVGRDADAPEFGGEYPGSKMGMAAAVRQAFSDAKWLLAADAAYAAKPAGRARPERFDGWVALGDAASGREPVVFEAPDVLALLRSAKIAAEFGLKARYVATGSDLYVLADEVKAAKPDLVLTLAFPAAPSVEDEDEWGDVSLQRLRAWDRAPSNPRWMRDLGLTFSLTTHGLAELSDLADRVKKARARGLSADDLLAAFTTIPARQLGLAGRAGEIVPGALANLVVSSGPLFTDRTRVLTTFVDGVPYEVRPKKGAVAGMFRLDGVSVALRSDPRTGLPGVGVTPAAGGKPVAATNVVRHGQRLTFDVDGAPLGLSGPQKAEAVVEGDSLRLDLRPAAGGPAVSRRAERDRAASGRGGPGADASEPGAAPAAAEKLDAPDSDVRPLPARWAAPLAAPKAVLVKNATVWTSGPKGTLENASVLVVDGKVAAVGKDVAVPASAASSLVTIDAQGRSVTPGLIDAHSHTAVDGGVNEGSHNISAEVRIGDVVNPFAPAIYRELAGGLTAANVLHGSSNAIGGQSEILKLKNGEGPDGLKLRDEPPGIKFALGENPKRSNMQGSGPLRYPQTRMGVSALIRERFAAARDYRRKQKAFEAAKKRGENAEPVRTDLQLEAIAEILEGKRAIHAHSYVKQEVLDLIRICEECGVKIGTLQHILEGYKVADEIATHGAGASSFSDWWAYKFEVYDAIPYNGALMRERGVLVSFNSDSDELARRMNVEAAKAVKYGGVPREEALKFVTANSAKQLKVEGRIGSLEPGKDGDFVVWSGDPLDATSHADETWIEGKKYFDRAEDVKARTSLGAEKAELIGKARLAASRGAAAAPAGPSARPAEHSCSEEEHATEASAWVEVAR
ncbi:MAG TPA: amidohydrolase family protein [Thermoanaerobaculia bacterium]|jgi:imidazolonepropionase-like amidohydrolase